MLIHHTWECGQHIPLTKTSEKLQCHISHDMCK